MIHISMSTLFISDLHLNPANPELIALTLEFLGSQTRNIQALYILGDLFNSWIGDDLVADEFLPVIDKFQQLSQQGVKIYLMVGNRDFLLGDEFSKQAGCQILTDPTIIDLYGTPTLLMHGDTLCTDDTAYQRYRYWTRISFLQQLFLKLPLRFRQGIANKIKQKSQEQKQFKSSMIMDVNQQTVMDTMQNHAVYQLIHGHTHRPAIHEFSIADHATRRIVLGDWSTDGFSMLRCDDDNIELVDPRVHITI